MRYKYGSVMRQIDDDPVNETEEGTIWLKAGDQSSGASRTVIDEESRGFVEVRSEALAVYGPSDHWMSEEEALDLTDRRCREEGLLEGER